MFIPELFFDYSFLIFSVICAALAFCMSIYYRGSKQKWTYLLIAIGFSFDVMANILWIPTVNYYGGPDDVPYPSYLDVFWLLNYAFFGTGILTYWLVIRKAIEKKLPIKWLVFIGAATIMTALASIPILNYYDALYDVTIDSLYVALPVFAATSCLPLISLLRGGKLSKSWFLLCIGGFIYAVAEILWIIELSMNSGHDFSNLLWLTGYVVFITAFTIMIKLLFKKNKRK